MAFFQLKFPGKSLCCWGLQIRRVFFPWIWTIKEANFISPRKD